MREANKKLIDKLFKKLEKGNITIEEFKEELLKEIDRVEDKWYAQLRDVECQLGDMEDLWQSRE